MHSKQLSKRQPFSLTDRNGVYKRCLSLILLFFAIVFSQGAIAEESVMPQETTMDRLALVTQQINILTQRLERGKQELGALNPSKDENNNQHVSKNNVVKATLDIAVTKSDLDSINIEIQDTHQTIGWLEKNIKEIENQLNVQGVFGPRFTNHQIMNPEEMRADLTYQYQLLELEKERYSIEQELQNTIKQLLGFRNDNQKKLVSIYKSNRILNAKQKQVKEELIYQEEQNKWLQTLNNDYMLLSKLNPNKDRDAYTKLERSIYYANEKANFAYVKSLIARYDDQLQQMKFAMLRNHSIGLLNEIRDQAHELSKQMDRLDTVLQSRVSALKAHINNLMQQKKNNPEFQSYLKNLSDITINYSQSMQRLLRLSKNLYSYRGSLDKSLQKELSARQGLPIFDVKTLFELGKEWLLLPALTFEMTKSLITDVIKSIAKTSMIGWVIFLIIQVAVLFLYFLVKSLIDRLVTKPSKWREGLNSKWISLQLLKRNLIDIFFVTDTILMMQFFGILYQRFRFLFFLFLVWLGIKTIMIVARLCLVETTHDSSGHDMRLYARLKWMIIAGGIIIALTVFLHQLPFIYELKSVFDRLFLCLLMMVSLILLRHWKVVPNLILSHIDATHPYIHHSVRLIGLLIPLLMLTNSVIGLFGYVNLIMSVSWYEGVFLVVLMSYLLIRGLLSDCMEQLSRIMIQYVNNGWLWTEAFLKPLDTILRLVLFITAWAALFLLYGWDKQSPIVERLTYILNYQLVHILNTSITPLRILGLALVISVFYWTAKWTREFVFRLLLSRTKDMGLRNTIAILSQYTVVVLGIFFCLRVLGINLQALALVSGMFAFGVGLGLRDFANNFASGFLILLERPLRVGDIVSISNVEGEVTNIGSRAITVRTWDHVDLVVPNSEVFNKSFTNWTANDNIVRTVIHVKICRYDNPHDVSVIIKNVLSQQKEVLADPTYEVFLKDISDTLMDFEIRYFVNIRQIKSRTAVSSVVLMAIWDAFALHGIKPPFPQQEIVLRNETYPALAVMPAKAGIQENVVMPEKAGIQEE